MTTLGEVADVNNLTIDRNYTFDEIEYIDVASVEERKLIGTQKLKLEDAPSRAKRIVSDNSILISTVRPNLKHYCFIRKARPNLVASTGFAVVNAKEGKSDPYFLYNLLTTKGYTDYLIKIADSQTSTYPAFNPSVIQNSVFLLPSFPEQRAIAAILSSLDNKIELLREQNKTLEATSQAIFKEWFVNFNFSGATGKMIDSELGQIPEGWRVGTVNDVIERYSITYRCDQKDLSPKGKTPILDQGSNGLYGYTEREPDFEASIENPVIIFTNHTCNMWFINYPFSAIQNIIPFRGNADYSSFFVFYLTLGQVKFIEYKGHWPNFEQKQYIIPTPIIANEFTKIVRPLQYKIWNNGSQIKTLSIIRDALLPKLMRGEVGVKNFT